MTHSATRRNISRFIVLGALLSGCETTRNVASHGQDLLENPGRSFLVRAPAGLGAIVGHVLAFPVSVLLVPTAFFESTYVRNADQGDIYISPVSASYDYGHGIGAAALGSPFDLLRGIFEEPPPRSPGTVDEKPELPPTEKDPKLDFIPHPPVPTRRLEPGESPAPPPRKEGEVPPPNTEFPRPGEKPATGDPTKDPAVKSPLTPTVPPPSDPGASAPKDAPREPSRG
jgi:hypothetical protein